MITGGTLLSLLLGWAGVEFAGTAIPGIIAVASKVMPWFKVGATVARKTGVDEKVLNVLKKAATGEGFTDDEKKAAAEYHARVRANPLDFS